MTHARHLQPNAWGDERTRQLRKVGTGISWGDWKWTVAALQLPGVADPRLGKYMDDGAGSTGVYGFHFDAGEVAPLMAEQIDHDYVEGTDIEPHVHFKLVNAPVIGKTVIWTIEYEIGPPVGPGPSTTSTATGTYTFDASDAQWDNVILDLSPAISGTGLTISSIGSITITRGGDYASEVLFGSVDGHYMRDGIGSDLEATKTYPYP